MENNIIKERRSKPEIISRFKKMWEDCPFLNTKIAPFKVFLLQFDIFYSSDKLNKFKFNLTKEDGSPFLEITIEKEGKKKLYLTQIIHPKQENQPLGYMQGKGAS